VFDIFAHVVLKRGGIKIAWPVIKKSQPAAACPWGLRNTMVEAQCAIFNVSEGDKGKSGGELAGIITHFPEKCSGVCTKSQHATAGRNGFADRMSLNPRFR
jgi:hypothetical protein